jgi:hypothetical protein
MKRTIGAIALVGGVMAAATAIALAGSTAFAENRVDEQRAQLAKLWGRDSAVTASQTATATMNSTAPDEQRRGYPTGDWADKHRTGRAHDRAER